MLFPTVALEVAGDNYQKIRTLIRPEKHEEKRYNGLILGTI
jgi:hypothetical protein